MAGAAVRTTTDPDLIHDLDEHGQGEAIAWVVLAGVWVGFVATAGWTVLTGVRVLRSVHARQVAGLPW